MRRVILLGLILLLVGCGKSSDQTLIEDDTFSYRPTLHDDQPQLKETAVIHVGTVTKDDRVISQGDSVVAEAGQYPSEYNYGRPYLAVFVGYSDAKGRDFQLKSNLANSFTTDRQVISICAGAESLAVATDEHLWLYYIGTNGIPEIQFVLPRRGITAIRVSDIGIILGILNQNGGDELECVDADATVLWRTSVSSPISKIAVSPTYEGRVAFANEQGIFTFQHRGKPPELTHISDTLPDSLAFSNDGKLLACGYQSGDVQVFDVATRKVIASANAGLGPVEHVDVLSDHITVAVAGGDRKLRIMVLGGAPSLSSRETDYATQPFAISMIKFINAGADLAVVFASGDEQIVPIR